MDQGLRLVISQVNNIALFVLFFSLKPFYKGTKKTPKQTTKKLIIYSWQFIRR